MAGTGVGWLVERSRTAPDAALAVGPSQPRAVLDVMKAEGLVDYLGAGIYLPRDSTVCRASRARAFERLVPERGVLALEAAAWVHGAPRPRPPFVVLTSGAVGPRRVTEDVRLMESPLPTSDVVDVGGVPVTSAARTAADIARWGEDETARACLRHLLSTVTSPREVRAVLAGQARFRHNRRARQRLKALTTGKDSPLWA